MTTLTDLAQLPVLDDDARRLLFTEARTANTFSPEPISDETLASIWELAKWPPTMANTQPLRVLFVRTPEGKERLVPLMSEGNQAKTAAAPVTAILAADVDFHEFIPEIFPIRPEMKDHFEAAGADAREPQARFNSALQAGYFLLAARAHGLATGPMLGYDAAGIDAEFFAGTAHKTVLVVNLGHAGEDAYFPRQPRLGHEDVISWA
ncbi:malonic semialdehyde reductase [Jatrophihabitans sp.]|uniref:malonic semialdehyde reductase n=1 Tax=Jatrophihabitans sp. TaxID=1932789 RepID=UPI0030C7163E|nr:nitroreductase [Jatrophihabitans sp.]